MLQTWPMACTGHLPTMLQLSSQVSATHPSAYIMVPPKLRHMHVHCCLSCTAKPVLSSTVVVGSSIRVCLLLYSFSFSWHEPCMTTTEAAMKHVIGYGDQAALLLV